jgi:hypothetical protein
MTNELTSKLVFETETETEPFHDEQDPFSTLLPKKQTKSNKHKKVRMVFFAMITVITIGIIIYFVYDAFISSSSSSSSTSPIASSAGLYGKWPCHGGNAQNQQISPSNSNSNPNEETLLINTANIDQVSLFCKYDITGGRPYSGYITIDDQNRAFVSIGSNVTCIDFERNCSLIWTVNIAHLLGYNSSSVSVEMRQTATLFQTSNGTKGVLFGAPNSRRAANNYRNTQPCYAIALASENGQLLWSTNMAEDDQSSYACRLHGFMVDTDDHCCQN